MQDRIRRLMKVDDLEGAIEELLAHAGGGQSELADDLIKLKGDLYRSEKEHRRGLITDEEKNKTRARAHYSILEALKSIDEAAASPAAGRPLSAPAVFISYNHRDADVADRLKAALEKSGISVRIDKAAMEAGDNIREFIERSVRDTDVTLSVVSNHSLLSAWVALESIETLQLEKFRADKRFIACYIDDDFFETDYRLKATKQIDAEIEKIDRLIPEYIARRIDTDDLNGQKSRLFDLRNNLGLILQRLRNSLCIDVREERFDENVARIVKAIK